MTMTTSTDRVFRPEDKAFNMLFPAVEENNLFDEFLDQDLYGLSNNDNGRASPFIDAYIPGIDKVVTPSPTRAPLQRPDTVAQPWRPGVWCLKSKPTSDLVVNKTRKFGRLAQKLISPTHLMTNEHSSDRNSALPHQSDTRSMTYRPKAAIVGDKEYGHHDFYHEPRRPLTLSHNAATAANMSYSEEHQQDLPNFHLQMPDNGTYLIPQHMTEPSHHEITVRQTNSRIVARNATIAHPPSSPTKYHYRFDHVSRHDNGRPEMIDAKPLALEFPPERSTTDLNQSHISTIPISDADQYHVPIWTTESLHSSDGSYQSQASQYSTESYPKPLTESPVLTWMSPPTASDMPYSQIENHMSIEAPAPQHPATRVLQHQQEQYYSGLGIHYTDADEIGMAITYDGPQSYAGQRQALTPLAIHTRSLSAFPPLPSLPSYPSNSFGDESPLATPHRRRPSSSHSPSPSPTRRSISHGLGQCSPIRTDYTRLRRKSIHKPGPIKDTSQPDAQRRTRSTSRPPRTPKTPKTPKTPTSATFAQIDFVNFTLKDSAKLMSDVAPSGSSRTRQRREQEAREKRKRLNEAALQAVRNAGGDVAALEDAIFV